MEQNQLGLIGGIFDVFVVLSCVMEWSYCVRNKFLCISSVVSGLNVFRVFGVIPFSQSCFQTCGSLDGFNGVFCHVHCLMCSFESMES